ncbi:MAG: fibronectin type III domain-containing protein [Spirochaetaceae bacterium]|jgi:hypothetical protein|nr:fibronectin type III domain-containing protein [Spirochaetaceae bacterium]
MKNLAVLLIIAALPGALFALGEKTLSAGGSASWRHASVKRELAELNGVRPEPVLTLASQGRAEETTDLYLSFDEGNSARFHDNAGNYTVRTGGQIQAADKQLARRGGGAALFSNIQTVAYHAGVAEPLVITPKSPAALFAPGRNIGDFSIEFFLYPANMESGEEIFDWTATQRRASGSQLANHLQSIQAIAAKNRVHWTFENFFTAPDGSASKNLTLTSRTALTPRRWSHHLIRFDAGTGMVEYIVNGTIEAISYATTTGTEGSEVWTPVAGERGRFAAGRQFNGILDEIIISGAFSRAETPHRYTGKHGMFETAPLDMGARGCKVRKIDVSGGIIKLSGNSMRNTYQRGGNFVFDGGAALQFFIRTANSPTALEQAVYQPFKSGMPVDLQSGRYAQIRTDFYPSGDLETAPYLENLTLEYLPKPAPQAPVRLHATARDGFVDLAWRETAGEEVRGYLVYYGTRQGEYFCEDAALGASPLDVGKVTRIRLDNLKNGVLYYFAVAAYDDSGPTFPGEFSGEVSARPLRMLE